MQTHTPQLWSLRIVTFSVAALAAASAAFWALKWAAPAPMNSTAALVFSDATKADPQVVARLLGGGQTAAVAAAVESLASRFKLIGVVADRTQGGYALIAIDGKPAKPYRVGAQIDDTLVLHSVAPRSASLATGVDAPPSVTLELPNLSRP